ncbi:MAG: cobalamin-binding protein, partial [Gammaproteobacteria bacterium]|nr:cobalamin-binding protein [Gammaproteobacteria bacterium]
MIIIYRGLIFLVLSYSLPVNAGQIVRILVEDDVKQTISFSRHVNRIVSLSPHITELLFAAGAGKKIVGV